MIIINLQKLTCKDKAIFDEFYGSRYCENAEYTFTNLFMWRDMLNLHWAIEDEVLYVFSSNEENFSAWQPIGSQDKMQDAINKILQVAEENRGDKEFMFVVVEKSFADELARYPNAKFNISADRDNFDYVYLAQDLINLSGRKFHGKKNHLNAFKKEYPDAKYLPITEEIIPQCREQLNIWYETHKRANPDDEFIFYERAAIHEIFDHFDAFKLKGGAILIDNRVVAFTFGEKLNSDTAVIHVEKADPTIRGIYVAINQSFVENEWADMIYINREEDMGIEGLRKAKNSYRPIKMIEKFNATLAK
ncbi:MAG: DUF2156 domain-containing protein [Selenomonadaceae bacterium]|nr:DUF2156 domain-containing protein [Selenomonadaceae bacterium]